MKTFLTLGRLEGVSFLLLLGVAMPLKYHWGLPMAVRVVGMVHGFLFIAYVAKLGSVAQEFRWSRKQTLLGFFAAVVPMGTFYFESLLRKQAA